MTDNLGYMGVALPEGYKIEQDERGRDVLVMKTEQADWLARLMQEGARRAREEKWDAASTVESLDDSGLAHLEEWRPGHFKYAPDAVVWTKPGALVMVQNIEPGHLSPFEAYELADCLKAAAHYASRPTEEP